MHDGTPRLRIRSAFTLVELLVASTIALVLMAALAILLGIFSRTASNTQGIVELLNRMRSVQQQLREDLNGATCLPRPPVPPAADSGYFEIIEGPQTDSGKPWLSAITYAVGDRVAFNGVSWVALAAGSNNQPGSSAAWSRDTPLTADIDDALAFTTRKSGTPFIGKYTYSNQLDSIESSIAELVWYCTPAPLAAQTVPGVTLHNLYRRQLIVLPYVGVPPFVDGVQLTSSSLNGRANSVSFPNTGLTADAWRGVYNGFLTSAFHCDLSLRREDVGSDTFLLPNSLSDLTKRENRFWRQRTVAPFTVNPFPHPLQTAVSPAFTDTTREGEDLVLTNVIAFDVRVFDPEAPVHAIGEVAVTPGDPAYPVPVTGVVDAPADLPGSTGVGAMYQVRATGRFYGRTASGWQILPLGAYVDLGWGIPAPTAFSPPPMPFPIAGSNPFPGSEDINGNGSLDGGEDTNSNGRIDRFTPFQGFGTMASNAPLNLMLPILTYDTWSTHYESDGLNQDGDAGLIDEGTNGADEDGDGLPDEADEQETSPPYPVPLRGIEVRIRCLDPVSKEIRQVTIRHAFVGY